MVTTDVLGVQICRWDTADARYSCNLANGSLLGNLDLPSDSCDNTPCHNCIVATRTIVVTNEGTFLPPSHFFERPTERRGNIQSFQCSETSDIRGDGVSIPCDCARNCTGTANFCKNFTCVDGASCTCDIRTVEYEFSHITSEETIVNPVLISFPICLFKILGKARKNYRSLLEFESASFTRNNLTLAFNDPVVTVSEPGKLIARASGNEIIVDVSNDLNIVLPVELVAYKDTLTLVFISRNGKAVHGDVAIDGKSTCRTSTCFLCTDFIFRFKCWPPYITYTFYVLLTVVVLIALCLLKYACKGILIALRTVSFAVFIQIKILKSFLRLFLLGGAVLGAAIRRHMGNLHHFLENNNPHFQPIPLTVALLLILGIFSQGEADCSSHSILASDMQNCQTSAEKRHCELFTTAEVTLKGLGYEACLWFQDTKRNNIFNLKLKLNSAQCVFSSRRKYFTFPVRAHTISQLACPQNFYCAWGEHCRPNKNFEALTEESLDYPGITRCHPSSVGSGCTIISRMGCLFYRNYFIPDLLHSYEVRDITGHQCTYSITVERESNGTKELLNLHSSAVTKDNIHLELLGAYNQAPLHISDSFVVRVGDNSEAYLIQSSPANRPIAGMVGQIQANTSYTKQFIFDKDIMRCDFFETTLRCETTPDGLQEMFTFKADALPLTRDLHLLQSEKGTLRSQLLSTAPVKVQLHFKNYKISIDTRDVCPKILDRDMTTKGCYACQILSEFRFTAVSNCHPGTVALELQTIQLYTQTIFLETEPKDFIIKFLAEQKCYDEKICLKSRNMKHCKLASFCLNEPSLNLLNLNTSYTKAFLKTDSSGSSFWDFISLPTFNGIFVTLKMMGTLLLIVCLTITLGSTCFTCCKR